MVRFNEIKFRVALASDVLNTMVNSFLVLVSLLYTSFLSAHVPFVPSGEACQGLGDALDKMIGTPKETPEKVVKILKKHEVSKCFSEQGPQTLFQTYDWYVTMAAKTARADVAQIMLSTGIIHMSNVKIRIYPLAARAKLQLKSCEIVPDSEDHKFIVSCFTNWQALIEPDCWQDTIAFDEITALLIMSGNVEVLKSLVNLGCRLPRCVSSLEYIFKNKIETVLYLFETPSTGDEDNYGFTMKNSQMLLESLFSYEEFTPDHLREAFRKGFLLDGFCFDAALHCGRFDLAKAAYHQGLRLSPHYWFKTPEELSERFVKLSLEEFAKYVAGLKIVPMIATFMTPGGDFDELPKELKTGIISEFLLRLDLNDCMKELFEPLENVPLEERSMLEQKLFF